MHHSAIHFFYDWKVRYVRPVRKCSSLNLSEFVVGRSWSVKRGVRRNEAPLFSRNWLENGEETRSPSASFYALQTAIDFPKMFRAPLGRLGAERFTVARHQHRDLTGRLSKMKQGTVHFRL